jgi:hypothetical protein
MHQCEKCGGLFTRKEDLEPARVRKHVWMLCGRCIDKLWDYLCNGGSGTPEVEVENK